MAEVDAWLAEQRDLDNLSIWRIPFAALDRSHIDESTGPAVAVFPRSQDIPDVPLPRTALPDPPG
jgi:hypothetical protein